MKNKTIAWGLITSYSVAVLLGMTDMRVIYAIAMISFVAFVIMATVRLFK